MKTIFRDNYILSIRADYVKGISGITETFSKGADYAYISCLSSDNFYLCDSNEIEKNIASDKQTGLDEIFANFNNNKFIIEIYGKSDKSDELSSIIRKHSMEDKVLICTQNSSLMKKIRKKLPETATAITPNEFLYLYFLFKTGFLYFKKRFKADCFISIESAGISYILNFSLIKELTKREIFTIALTDATEKQIKRLIDSGCRGFVVNNEFQLKIVKELMKF